MSIVDSARCAQVAQNRAFIYITHQKRGVTLFASRELSPIGVGKKRIESRDAMAPTVEAFISRLLSAARRAGVGQPGNTPNAEKFRSFVPEIAAALGVQAEFLSRTPAYSARILVTQI